MNEPAPAIYADPTEITEPSTQTLELLQQLRDHGFTASARTYGVRAGIDGFVENPAAGITVHADDEVVRIIVDARDDLEAHRLLVVRLGMEPAASLRVAAVYVRLLLEARTR